LHAGLVLSQPPVGGEETAQSRPQTAAASGTLGKNHSWEEDQLPGGLELSHIRGSGFGQDPEGVEGSQKAWTWQHLRPRSALPCVGFLPPPAASSHI
jgi:hypothetical protein